MACDILPVSVLFPDSHTIHTIKQGLITEPDGYVNSN